MKLIKKGSLYLYNGYCNDLKSNNGILTFFKDINFEICNNPNDASKVECATRNGYYMEIWASPVDYMKEIKVQSGDCFLALDDNPIRCVFKSKTYYDVNHDFYSFLYGDKIYWITKLLTAYCLLK